MTELKGLKKYFVAMAKYKISLSYILYEIAH